MNKPVTRTSTPPASAPPASAPLARTLRHGDTIEMVDKDGRKVRLKFRRCNGAWRVRIFAPESTHIKFKDPPR